MDLVVKIPGVVSLVALFKLGLCALTVYLVLGPIRRVYFHPLSKFKGPKLYAATNLVPIWFGLRGEWVHKVLELHEKYGPVVRVAPNEISYISADAWSDIYKTSRGQEQLKKYMPAKVPGRQNGLFSNPRDDEHALIRKKLSSAFSDRGIREREGMVLKHVSFMAKQLDHYLQTSLSNTVDIVVWYQCITTDVVGDLLSGEDFGALANSRPHPMMESNLRELKGLAIGTALNRNIFTRNILVKLRRLRHATPHYLVAHGRFDRHLEEKRTDGTDLISLLTKDMDTPSNITTPRARRVTAELILTGTDTVAITLSGATYLLLRNPEKYAKLRDEVRSTFSSAEDISLAGVNALKYQNAVILESLRLWPPGPETTRRVVNSGGKLILGEHVPANTLVGVYHWAANRYTRAWKDTGSFIPERWLSASSDSDADKDDEFADDDRGVMQPYNVGPRNCVGQNLANAELRLILAAMVWHFDMALEDPSDENWMDVRIFGLMTERKPLRVKLTRKNSR